MQRGPSQLQRPLPESAKRLQELRRVWRSLQEQRELRKRQVRSLSQSLVQRHRQGWLRRQQHPTRDEDDYGSFKRVRSAIWAIRATLQRLAKSVEGTITTVMEKTARSIPFVLVTTKPCLGPAGTFI